MVALGAVLVFVGFALVTPRGATPGSASRRVVRFNNLSGPFVTPGYQNPTHSTRRGTLRRIGLGLGLIALGIVCIGIKIGF